MRSRRVKTQGYAVCMRNAGFGASLEVRKLYPVVDDADAETNDLIRVVDESGRTTSIQPAYSRDSRYPAKFSGLCAWRRNLIWLKTSTVLKSSSVGFAHSQK